MNTHIAVAVIFVIIYEKKKKTKIIPCLNLCLTHTSGQANYSIFVCNTGNDKYTINCITAVIKALCTLASKLGVT